REKTAKHLGGNAGTGIAHYHGCLLTAGWFQFDIKRASIWHGIESVQQDVDEHGVKLVSICIDQRSCFAGLNGDFNFLLPGPRTNKVDGAVDRVTQIEELPLRFRQPCEIEKPLYGLLEARHFTANYLEILDREWLGIL